eukprot:3476823-Amphidinium_carterae.1
MWTWRRWYDDQVLNGDLSSMIEAFLQFEAKNAPNGFQTKTLGRLGHKLNVITTLCKIGLRPSWTFVGSLPH